MGVAGEVQPGDAHPQRPGSLGPDGRRPDEAAVRGGAQQAVPGPPRDVGEERSVEVGEADHRGDRFRPADHGRSALVLLALPEFPLLVVGQPDGDRLVQHAGGHLPITPL